MNLYIVSSPLHIFLTLLHKKNHSNSFCILIDEENKLKNYYTLISQSFEKSLYIGFPKKRLSKYLKFSLFTKRIFPEYKLFLKIFADIKYDNIYLFNDHFIGTQVFINSLNSKKVVFIEDGSTVYNQWIFKKNYARQIFYKIMFGDNVVQVGVMGTHPSIQARLVLYPNNVREELQDNKTSQFIVRSDVKKISEIMLETLGYHQEIVKNKKALFILSRLNTYCEIEWINAKIKEFSSDNIKCYLKYHPLSDEAVSPINPDTKYLKSDLPVEIIASILDFEVIIGPPSSSLYIVKFLFPNTRVICLSDKKNLLSRKFIKMLTQIGVENLKVL
jgi:hypothetical protein